MALQAIANISVDFYDKKYISINTKQLDKKTRFLSVTCYSHGELCSLNSGEHSAFIRYRKPDGYCVFNLCDIDIRGRILVELTEQMLAISGVCYTELVVVNKGSAKVNSNGEITVINNSGILSTMPFYVNVSESAFENSTIESSYEYDGLNELLERAEADYENVVKTSRSWAVGSTGIRDGENTNNSKYWSTQSENSANASNASALNAAESERIADEHKDTAIIHSGNAYTYMTNAEDYMDRAIEAEANASNSEKAAKTSETNAKTSETNSKTSEEKSLTSEQNAKTSELNAKSSEEKSLNSEIAAKTSETNALTSEQNAKTSETNASVSEENAKNAQAAAEIAENNAEQAAAQAAEKAAELAAEQAAEQAAQNAVNNAITLMNDYVIASQEAATSAENSKQSAKTSEGNALDSANKAQFCYESAQNIVAELSDSIATVHEVKDYLDI